MKISSNAESILQRITGATKLGDLRKIASNIKKDQELAMELWQTGKFLPRQLAILIMDGKVLSQEVINTLDTDIQTHPFDERIHLADWLMANQLTKDKKTIALIASWEHSPSALQRRIFWYHQARLRWMGQTPPDNTDYLISEIEKNIANEKPEVQWAMNFLAGWIGVYDVKYRTRCMAIGESTGLYKDEKVSKGCTPNYLPHFIEIERKKRNI